MSISKKDCNNHRGSIYNILYKHCFIVGCPFFSVMIFTVLLVSNRSFHTTDGKLYINTSCTCIGRLRVQFLYLVPQFQSTMTLFLYLTEHNNSTWYAWKLCHMYKPFGDSYKISWLSKDWSINNYLFDINQSTSFRATEWFSNNLPIWCQPEYTSQWMTK